MESNVIECNEWNRMESNVMNEMNGIEWNRM